MKRSTNSSPIGPPAGVWEVEIPPHFLEKGVELLLGVETDLQIEELAPLFAKGRTVLASPDLLPEVRRLRIEGVPCRRDPSIHPSLRDREGLAFLKIDRKSDFWPPVEESRKLQLAREASATELSSFFLYGLGIKRRER